MIFFTSQRPGFWILIVSCFFPRFFLVPFSCFLFLSCCFLPCFSSFFSRFVDVVFLFCLVFSSGCHALPEKTCKLKSEKYTKKNAKSEHQKKRKKPQTIAIARTSSVAQKISQLYLYIYIIYIYNNSFLPNSSPSHTSPSHLSPAFPSAWANPDISMASRPPPGARQAPPSAAAAVALQRWAPSRAPRAPGTRRRRRARCPGRPERPVTAGRGGDLGIGSIPGSRGGSAVWFLWESYEGVEDDTHVELGKHVAIDQQKTGLIIH